MRLTDELAARRRLYPRPVSTAPAIMVIDVPRRWAGASLPLGRFYPVIIETDEELAEFEAYLAAPRSGPIMPNLLAERPSSLTTTVITFFEFRPPADGWPWLLLCHWPADLAAAGAFGADILARGSYTIETYASRDELIVAARSFISLLGGTASIRTYAELSDAAGNA